MHARHIAVVAWYLPALTDPAVDLRRALAAARFVSLTASASTRSRSTSRRASCGMLASGRAACWRSRRACAPQSAGLSARSDHPLAGRDEEAQALLARVPVRGLARQYDAFVPMAYYSSRMHTPPRSPATRSGASRSSARRAAGRAADPLIGGMASPTSTSEATAFVRTIVSCGVAGFSLYDYSGTKPALWRVLQSPGRAAAPVWPASRVRVGVQLPEVEREVRWPELRAIALAAERGGFDSIWVGDHMLYRGDGRPERGPWDVWTTLAALAAATERVRLGPLVASLAFHPPGLVARMAASIDEVSQGRFTLGVGAGWNEAEFRAFGIPYDNRVARFEEAFEIVRRLVGGERVSFTGRYHQVEDAVLLPRPARPRPAHGRDDGPAALRRRGAHVDWWNVWYSQYGNTPSGYAELSSRFAGDSSAARACWWPSNGGGGERPLIRRRRPSTSPRSPRHLHELEEAGADEAILVLDPITEASVGAVANVLSSGSRMPYAAVNGLELYYEVHGDGPPLLLLHGGSGSIPEKWIPDFAPEFQVIAPEQMGHGHCRPRRSPVPLPRHGRGHRRADAPAQDRGGQRRRVAGNASCRIRPSRANCCATICDIGKVSPLRGGHCSCPNRHATTRRRSRSGHGPRSSDRLRYEPWSRRSRHIPCVTCA